MTLLGIFKASYQERTLSRCSLQRNAEHLTVNKLKCYALEVLIFGSDSVASRKNTPWCYSDPGEAEKRTCRTTLRFSTLLLKSAPSQPRSLIFTGVSSVWNVNGKQMHT
jgi:hypothetical protein